MRLLAGLTGALIVATVAGCSSEPSGPPTDPLDQMVVAFDGSPSRDDIKEAMDRALSATDVAASDDTYSRAGSVLVTYRKEYGLSEMDVLECIPNRAGDPRVSQLDFPSVAAVCVTDMRSGEYP